MQYIPLGHFLARPLKQLSSVWIFYSIPLIIFSKMLTLFHSVLSFLSQWNLLLNSVQSSLKVVHLCCQAIMEWTYNNGIDAIIRL
jgi:hypothetical protein